MIIALNGQESDARGAQTIDELVQRLELPSQSILIEHNGHALHRREWSSQKLQPGDRVEFLRVVAGG
jgi:sulfur carrier protein